MSAMHHEWIKKNAQFSVLYPAVDKMIAGTCKICAGILVNSPTFRPFHENENGGVSLLLAGAATAGLFPMSEYPVTKKAWAVIEKQRLGQRITKADNSAVIKGRADLWLYDGMLAFSFEFKKTSERNCTDFGQKRIENDLCRSLNLAVDEISRVDIMEYHKAMGGLIAPIFDFEKEQLYMDFAKKVPLCVTIGDNRSYKVYIYFSKKRIEMGQ
jgi:hypothetical protein